MLLLIEGPCMYQTTWENNSCIPRLRFKSKFGKYFTGAIGTYSFILAFVVPSISFTVFYTAVFYAFYKRRKSIELASSRVIDKASRDMTKSAITVTVIFVCCMGITYSDYMVRSTGLSKDTMTSTLARTGIWTASFNSSANPFIYALLMPAYRRSFAKTFCWK